MSRSFKRESDERIGAHLRELIRKNHDSVMQFCSAYIRADGHEISRELLSEVADRVYQISDGLEPLAAEELPVFSDVLGVSFEDILSAGECCGDGQLKRSMIFDAVRENDIPMLEKLHAREGAVPGRVLKMKYDNAEFDAGRDYELLDAIASAESEVVMYFCEEFHPENGGRRNCIFVYPYASDIVDLLVKNGSPNAKPFINQCIAHNKNIYGNFRRVIEKSHDAITARPGRTEASEKLFRSQLENWLVFEDGGFVFYVDVKNKNGIAANIVSSDAVSDDSIISVLLAELNDSFGKVRSIGKEFACENGKS